MLHTKAYFYMDVLMKNDSTKANKESELHSEMISSQTTAVWRMTIWNLRTATIRN